MTSQNILRKSKIYPSNLNICIHQKTAVFIIILLQTYSRKIVEVRQLNLPEYSLVSIRH